MNNSQRSTMVVLTDVSPYASGPAGVHGVLDQAAKGLRELGAMAGLEAVVVADAEELDESDIARARVLALFTIGETPFSAPVRGAIESAWREGSLGILGVHSSTDACRGWAVYGDMLGARFDGHPWTQEFDIDVLDTTHPSTSHLDRTWRWRDEVYLFADLHPEATVLLELAPGQLDFSVPEARTPDCGFPLAWTVGGRKAAGPRTFYTALGHFSGAWETPAYLSHLLGGIRWLLAGDPGKT